MNRRDWDHGPFADRRCKDLTKGELLTGNEKSWLGQQILEKRATAKFLSKMYNLPTTTLYSYVHKVKHGKILRKDHGKPPLVDDIGVTEIQGELRKLQQERNCLNRREFTSLVCSTAKASSLRAGGNGLVPDVSASTLYRMRKKANLSVVSPQTTTSARMNATMDIRNFYVEALIEAAYMNVCDPNLVINADATTFAVYGNGMETRVMVVKEDKLGPATVHDPSFLGIYVKVYNQISLGLTAAPSVFVVADDSLSDDDFFVTKINRLTHECQVTSYGYLCVCKSRGANDAFYKWFFEVAVVIMV